MGMCSHPKLTEEGKKAKLRSSKIEQDLYEHARNEMNVVKILMLGKSKALMSIIRFDQSVAFMKRRIFFVSGAAESGKSTLIKQIKIIHSRGFSETELLSFKVFERLRSF